MKRLTSIATVALVSLAASMASAQVIGTYRPSVVTYYPARSVTPVSYQQPLYQQPVQPVAQSVSYAPAGHTSVSYAPTSYTPVTYASQNYASASNCAPVYSASHLVATPIANNCTAPIQTVAYSQSAPCLPVTPTAYTQPVGAAVQPIAVPPAVPPGTIDSQYYIGRGLLGRPKVFKVGQPLRNTVRRILP